MHALNNCINGNICIIQFENKGYKSEKLYFVEKNRAIVTENYGNANRTLLRRCICDK